MKHKFFKLLALTLALTMILPLALLGCSDAILNDTVMNNIQNNDASNNNGGTTTPQKTTEAVAALDLTAEWEKLNGENTLVQGCLVVRTEFAEQHPDEVAKFLADYKASIETVMAGGDEAANLVVSAGILPKLPIAKKALPGCNLCYFAGNDMKPLMTTFYEKLLAVNPQSIGGKLPDDGLYYTENGNASAADPNTEIRIMALSGTTALGMAKMIVDVKNGESDMNYNIAELQSDPQLIKAALLNGDCDIAALPTNLASAIYNASQGKVKLLALNTLGVLYLLQSKGYPAVSSLNDLKGKTVYVPSANPEQITIALLQSAGLVIGTDVIVDATTYATPDELANAFAAGLIELAVLPEPKVTVALTQANAQK